MWLKVESQRKGPDQEYKRIEVYDQPLQTDMAIIAAVVASEADPVAPEDFREGRAALLYKYFSLVPVSETPTTETSDDIAPVDALLPAFRWYASTAEALQRATHTEPKLRNATTGDEYAFLRNIKAFATAELLLRHFRPDYDELSMGEQAALIEATCGRLNGFHAALKELTSFVEYGQVNADTRKPKKLKPGIKDARRDIRAALYKHVEGLSNEEIGERQGTGRRGAAQESKRDDSTARTRAGRGTDLLRRAWGQEGSQELIKSIKSDRDRWRELPEGERWLELVAEQIANISGISKADALRIIELGEPDKDREGVSHIYEAFSRGVDKLPG
jgi:hypothetical protein